MLDDLIVQPNCSIKWSSCSRRSQRRMQTQDFQTPIASSDIHPNDPAQWKHIHADDSFLFSNSNLWPARPNGSGSTHTANSRALSACVPKLIFWDIFSFRISLSAERLGEKLVSRVHCYRCSPQPRVYNSNKTHWWVYHLLFLSSSSSVARAN
jgi:hypothetical protein